VSFVQHSFLTGFCGWPFCSHLSRALCVRRRIETIQDATQKGDPIGSYILLVADERGQRGQFFVTGTDEQRLTTAEARIARQRELIALLEARRRDTSEAKSLLSGLQYSLKLPKQRRPADDRWSWDAGEQRITHAGKRRRYSVSGTP
jgi:hypothetical protein